MRPLERIEERSVQLPDVLSMARLCCRIESLGGQIVRCDAERLLNRKGSFQSRQEARAQHGFIEVATHCSSSDRLS
jgi:hypothetical protein